MNGKVYAAAARLTDEERKRDRGAFFGSIHDVLNHILVADRIWLGRLAGRVPEPGFIGVDGIKKLDQEIASDFDELHRDSTASCVSDRGSPSATSLASRP